MEASFMITQVETTLSNYTNHYRRLGMQDLAIWQSLCQYYAQPHSFCITLTNHLTKEEAFDQMVKDNWFDNVNGHYFYGLDYENIDEGVLEYLIENNYAKRMEEEND